MTNETHPRLVELEKENQVLAKQVLELQATNKALRERLKPKTREPRVGRAIVRWMMQDRGFSERQACELIGVHRSSMRYQPLGESDSRMEGPSLESQPDLPGFLRDLAALRFEVRYKPRHGRFQSYVVRIR